MNPIFSGQPDETELGGLSYLSDKATFFTVGYTVLMSSVFLLGISGNGLVIYVLIFRWCARSTFTYYTAGLATYQLLKCILLAPALLFIRWSGSDFSKNTSQWLCKIYQACIIFFTLCTAFIKVMSSLDRFKQWSRPWRMTRGQPVLLFFLLVVLICGAFTVPAFTIYGHPANSSQNIEIADGMDCQIIVNSRTNSFRFYHCRWDGSPTRIFTARVFTAVFAALYFAAMFAVITINGTVACHSARHRHMSTKDIGVRNAESSIAARLYDPLGKHAGSKHSSLSSSQMKSMASLMRDMMVDEDRHGQKYLQSAVFPIGWSEESQMIDDSAFMFSNLRTGYETDQQFYQIIMEDKLPSSSDQDASFCTSCSFTPPILQNSPSPTPTTLTRTTDSGPYRAIVTPAPNTDVDIVTLDLPSTDQTPSRKISYTKSTNLFHLAFSETDADDPSRYWSHYAGVHQHGGTPVASFSSASGRKAHKQSMLLPGSGRKENRYLEEKLEGIRSLGAIDRTTGSILQYARNKSLAENKHNKTLTVSLTDGICRRLGLVQKSADAVYGPSSSVSEEREFAVMRWKQIVAKAQKNMEKHPPSSFADTSYDFKEDDDRGSETDDKMSYRSNHLMSISGSNASPTGSYPDSCLLTSISTPPNKVRMPTYEDSTLQDPSLFLKEGEEDTLVNSIMPSSKKSFAPVNNATTRAHKTGERKSTVESMGKSKRISKSVDPPQPLSKNSTPPNSGTCKKEKLTSEPMTPLQKVSSEIPGASSNFFDLLRYHMSPTSGHRESSAMQSLKEKMSSKDSDSATKCKSSKPSRAEGGGSHALKRSLRNSRKLFGGKYTDKMGRHHFRGYHQESRGIVPYPRTAIYTVILVLCNFLSYVPSVVFTIAGAFNWHVYDLLLHQRILEVLFFVHDVVYPVVVCLLNLSFRNEIIDIFGLNPQQSGSRGSSINIQGGGSAESFF